MNRIQASGPPAGEPRARFVRAVIIESRRCHCGVLDCPPRVERVEIAGYVHLVEHGPTQYVAVRYAYPNDPAPRTPPERTGREGW